MKTQFITEQYFNGSEGNAMLRIKHRDRFFLILPCEVADAVGCLNKKFTQKNNKYFLFNSLVKLAQNITDFFIKCYASFHLKVTRMNFSSI